MHSWTELALAAAVLCQSGEEDRKRGGEFFKDPALRFFRETVDEIKVEEPEKYREMMKGGGFKSDDKLAAFMWDALLKSCGDAFALSETKAKGFREAKFDDEATQTRLKADLKLWEKLARVLAELQVAEPRGPRFIAQKLKKGTLRGADLEFAARMLRVRVERTQKMLEGK